MAAKKTSTSKAPSKKTTKPTVNKSQFIRDNPSLSVKDLIAKAKKAGFALTPAFVYTLRSEARRAANGKAKTIPSAAKKPSRKAPRIADELERLILRLGTDQASTVFNSILARVKK